MCKHFLFTISRLGYWGSLEAKDLTLAFGAWDMSAHQSASESISSLDFWSAICDMFGVTYLPILITV